MAFGCGLEGWVGTDQGRGTACIKVRNVKGDVVCLKKTQVVLSCLAVSEWA